MRRDPLAWDGDRPPQGRIWRRQIAGRITVMVLIWVASFVWCITTA